MLASLIFSDSDSKNSQGKLDPDKRKSLIQQGKDLKDSLAVLEAKLEALQDSLQHEGQLLPNLAHPSVSFLCGTVAPAKFLTAACGKSLPRMCQVP